MLPRPRGGLSAWLDDRLHDWQAAWALKSVLMLAGLILALYALGLLASD